MVCVDNDASGLLDGVGGGGGGSATPETGDLEGGRGGSDVVGNGGELGEDNMNSEKSLSSRPRPLVPLMDFASPSAPVELKEDECNRL